MLVPPAPRGEVDRVAAEVLGGRGPSTPRWSPHGPRARRRRWTRALVPAVAVAVAAARARRTTSLRGSWCSPWRPWPPGSSWPWTASRGLGHALVDGHLVARSGSLNRRREALATASVIGWNLRSSWFQRRAGLADLVATTAGGRQHVRVLDLPEDDAVALAHEAHGALLEPFLVHRLLTAP